MLHHPIVILILEYCCLENLYKIFIKNKILPSKEFPNYKKLLEKKVEYIYTNFPESLINIMGGPGKMISYPRLLWSEKFLGFTGYIDRIISKDVTYPIMLGKDPWDRSFITIRYTPIIPCILSKNPKIVTLFQRYTNDNQTWTHGSFGSCNFMGNGYFLSNGKIKPEIEKTLTQLLCNKEQTYLLV